MSEYRHWYVEAYQVAGRGGYVSIDMGDEGDDNNAALVLKPDEARLLGLKLIRCADKAEESIDNSL